MSIPPRDWDKPTGFGFGRQVVVSGSAWSQDPDEMDASSSPCGVQRIRVVKMAGYLHFPHGSEPRIHRVTELHASVIALSRQ